MARRGRPAAHQAALNVKNDRFTQRETLLHGSGDAFGASSPGRATAGSEEPWGTNVSGMPNVSAGTARSLRASSLSTASPTPPRMIPPSTVTTSFVCAAPGYLDPHRAALTQRMSTTRLDAALGQQLGRRFGARHHTSGTRGWPNVVAFADHARAFPSSIPAARQARLRPGRPCADSGWRKASPSSSAVCNACTSSASLEGASTRICGIMRM